MSYSREEAKKIAKKCCKNKDEKSLVESFVEISSFLNEFPEALSWKGNEKPSLDSEEGLKIIAETYFKGYRKSDFPPEPSTIPDEMVSVIMKTAYGYNSKAIERIKLEHQHSMCAENCVGNLLERYIDSVLRKSDWCWCCGDFVKAIDFIGKDDNGKWQVLQIKNRDNTENSSSKAVRDNTTIQKWYRSYSKDIVKGRDSFTRWDKLPSLMQGYGLCEDNFKAFVIKYLKGKKPKKVK